MAKIYKSAAEFIGKTPLVEVMNVEKEHDVKARLLVKVEYQNPAGSVKDRAALYMIQDAEEKGILKEGSVIIEPTSGNTGIGLAALAAAKGYRVILTMPETMSVERRNILKAYGAEIVLTSGSEGMKGAIDKAEELAKKEHERLEVVAGLSADSVDRLRGHLQVCRQLFCAPCILIITYSVLSFHHHSVCHSPQIPDGRRRRSCQADGGSCHCGADPPGDLRDQ